VADQRRIELENGLAVTAIRYPATGPSVATLVLAHGAGASQFSDFMVHVATALADRHLDVVTFNFPFTERGKKLPDPQPVLESCYRTVLAHVAADPDLGRRPLIIGGKSLGARMATHLAAARDAADSDADTWWDRLAGLVLLGYRQAAASPRLAPASHRASHAGGAGSERRLRLAAGAAHVFRRALGTHRRVRG
jgi:predicted alpha/beta-hydrolase family hydrolase